MLWRPGVPQRGGAWVTPWSLWRVSEGRYHSKFAEMTTEARQSVIEHRSFAWSGLVIIAARARYQCMWCHNVFWSHNALGQHGLQHCHYLFLSTAVTWEGLLACIKKFNEYILSVCYFGWVSLNMGYFGFRLFILAPPGPAESISSCAEPELVSKN